MGHLTTPASGTYCMTKHAVEAVTGCSRAELARFGISVSVLNPGYVRTGIAAKSQDHQTAVVAKLRTQYSDEQQALYPPVFDAALQEKLAKKALKNFEVGVFIRNLGESLPSDVSCVRCPRCARCPIQAPPQPSFTLSHHRDLNLSTSWAA